LRIRSAAATDEDAVAAFLDERGSRRVARLGRLEDALSHPALIAEGDDGRLAGVLTYVLDGGACEILTLHASEPRGGAGTALIAAAERLAAERGCSRLWVLTTNDNLDALRFYQRRGFRLAELRAGAVDEARRTLKPEIPEDGEHGIPIRDELILEKEVAR
jgi:N-acetylglutamate synthase-like GNAT family acetyltransferase